MTRMCKVEYCEEEGTDTIRTHIRGGDGSRPQVWTVEVDLCGEHYALHHPTFLDDIRTFCEEEDD